MEKKQILLTKELPLAYVKDKLGEDVDFSFLKVIEPIATYKQLPDFSNVSHFIFTSKVAVDMLGENLSSKQAHFYTVGQKAQYKLLERGYKTDIVAKNANELAEKIIETLKPCKIVHFCSSKALDILRKKLSETGFEYIQQIIYKTTLLFPVLEDNNYDAIVFFSPSGVESFFKHNKIQKDQDIFAIGETTKKSLLNYTNNKIITSTEETLDNLLKLIKDY